MATIYTRILTVVLVTIVVISSIILVLPNSWLPPLSLSRFNGEHSFIQDITIAVATPADTSAIPMKTREFWMRRAITALDDLESPCPFAAFGTVIVNHTSTSSSDHGDIVCIGANNISIGNPTLHGEIAGINNCTAVLTDPRGQYRLSPAEARVAWKDLTLYTTAEPCPMCATAIRLAGFRECVFGTSMKTLIRMGWAQIDLPSRELFLRSEGLGTRTTLVEEVLTEETDPYFAWQFDGHASCPKGCGRTHGAESATCLPTIDNGSDL